jgi:hypothetical protein
MARNWTVFGIFEVEMVVLGEKKKATAKTGQLSLIALCLIRLPWQKFGP